MTGKKKILKGGMIHLIPNQPKYNPQTVTNSTINELFDKLTRNQSIMNNLRSRQRLQNFLKILNYKLFKYTFDPMNESKRINNRIQIDVKQFVFYYNYFYEIYNKYKDTLIRDLQRIGTGEYPILLKNAMTKLDSFKKKFIEEEKIKENFIFSEGNKHKGILTSTISGPAQSGTFHNLFQPKPMVQNEASMANNIVRKSNRSRDNINIEKLSPVIKSRSEQEYDYSRSIYYKNLYNSLLELYPNLKSRFTPLPL